MEDYKKVAPNFKYDGADLEEWKNKFKDLVGDVAKVTCITFLYNYEKFQEFHDPNEYINKNEPEFGVPKIKTRIIKFFEYYTPLRDKAINEYLIDSLNKQGELVNFGYGLNIRNAIRNNIFSIYNSEMHELKDFGLYGKVQEYEEEFVDNVQKIMKWDEESEKNKTKLKYRLAVSNINTIIESMKDDLNEFIISTDRNQMYYNRLIFILNYIKENFFI